MTLIHIHVLPCTNFHYPLKCVGVENVYNTELKWNIRTESLGITEYSECQTRHKCIMSEKCLSKFLFLKLKSVSGDQRLLYNCQLFMIGKMINAN